MSSLSFEIELQAWGHMPRSIAGRVVNELLDEVGARSTT
jgi:hypothetical protein